MSRPLPLLVCLALAAAAAGCAAGPDEPPPPPGAAQRPADPAALVRGFSDERLAGALLMPYAYGAGATAVSAGARRANQKLAGVATPAEMVARYHLGGLILMRGDGDGEGGGDLTNLADPAQVRGLTSALQRAAGDVPLLIGVDQEHGVVTRLRDGVTLFPSAMAFGAAGDASLTERAASAAGTELAAVGINVDFAPTADVTGGAANTVIGSRSYGGAAGPVATQVAAAVRGYEKSGVAATLKHFPGHGHTATDSHLALPVLPQTRAELLADDVAPFVAGIAAGASLVMAGHLQTLSVDPTQPGTFSRKVLVDLLRSELGFDGVVVTDAMNMAAITDRAAAGEAAVRAVLAGNDLVLMPADLPAAYTAVLGALRSGRLPRAQILASVTRLVTLRLRVGGRTQPGLSEVTAKAHRTLAADSAAAAVTILRGACTGPLVRGPVEIVGGSAQSRAALGEDLRRLGVAQGKGETVNLIGYADDASALHPAAVTVALDTPYLLADAPSPVVVAAYSSVPASLNAVAAVLAGKARARGHTPVPVRGLPASACG